MTSYKCDYPATIGYYDPKYPLLGLQDCTIRVSSMTPEGRQGVRIKHSVISDTGATETLLENLSFQQLEWWVMEHGVLRDDKGELRITPATSDTVDLKMPHFIPYLHQDAMQKKPARPPRYPRPTRMFCDLTIRTEAKDHDILKSVYRIIEDEPRQLVLIEHGGDSHGVQGCSLEAVMWELDRLRVPKDSHGRYDRDVFTPYIDLTSPQILQSRFETAAKRSDMPAAPLLVTGGIPVQLRDRRAELATIELINDLEVRLCFNDMAERQIPAISFAAVCWWLEHDGGAKRRDEHGRLLAGNNTTDLRNPAAIQTLFEQKGPQVEQPFVPSLEQLRRNIGRMKSPSAME